MDETNYPLIITGNQAGNVNFYEVRSKGLNDDPEEEDENQGHDIYNNYYDNSSNGSYKTPIYPPSQQSYTGSVKHHGSYKTDESVVRDYTDDSADTDEEEDSDESVGFSGGNNP